MQCNGSDNWVTSVIERGENEEVNRETRQVRASWGVVARVVLVVR